MLGSPVQLRPCPPTEVHAAPGHRTPGAGPARAAHPGRLKRQGGVRCVHEADPLRSARRPPVGRRLQDRPLPRRCPGPRCRLRPRGASPPSPSASSSPNATCMPASAPARTSPALRGSAPPSGVAPTSARARPTSPGRGPDTTANGTAHSASGPARSRRGRRTRCARSDPHPSHASSGQHRRMDRTSGRQRPRRPRCAPC